MPHLKGGVKVDCYESVSTRRDCQSQKQRGVQTAGRMLTGTSVAEGAGVHKFFVRRTGPSSLSRLCRAFSHQQGIDLGLTVSDGLIAGATDLTYQR
jgi:hypothetical protein